MGIANDHITHRETAPSNSSVSADSTAMEKSGLEPQPHAEHGALIDHKVPQDDVIQAQPDLLWSRVRHSLREPLAEFFGTFILIMFGDGVVAQVVLSGGKNGDYQSITWGWGLGVMLGVVCHTTTFNLVNVC